MKTDSAKVGNTVGGDKFASVARPLRNQGVRAMKTLASKSAARITSAFSYSLSPINRIGASTFGLRERLCCVALLAVVATAMRLFLAK